MATKEIYKRGNIYWIRFTGPDDKIKFESSRFNIDKPALGLSLVLKHNAVILPLASDQVFTSFKSVWQVSDNHSDEALNKESKISLEVSG